MLQGFGSSCATEVDQVGSPRGIEQHVFGVEVAVGVAVGVGGRQGVGDFGENSRQALGLAGKT